MAGKNKILLHVVMDEVAKAKTRKDKSDVLLKYNSQALRDFLHGSFDDNIQWNLPKGSPPFKEHEGDDFQYMEDHTLKLYMFVKGGKGEKIPVLTRESTFIKMLEAIHPKDAELIIAMKDKKVEGRFKGLTKKLIKDTFPNLMPNA
jgi:hypothetical protein